VPLTFDLYSGARKLAFGEEWGRITFPDGQKQFWSNDAVTRVVCSVRNPDDLDLFIQIGAVWNVRELKVNYAYGSRSDKYDGKHCNVDRLFWRIVEQYYHLARTVVLDPHGDHWHGIAEATGPDIEWPEYDLAVYPDESAEKRQRVNPPDCACTSWEKKRDQSTGRIIEHSGTAAHGLKVIVMDDLCDGGATFVSMAKSYDDPHLYVTHGIFSKGLKVLADAGYTMVYTTNSYHRELKSGQFDGLELVVADVWT